MRHPHTVIAVAALVGVACGSGSSAPEPGPRRLMLRDLARTVIVPTYQDLAAEAEVLVTAAAQLDASPGAPALAAMQEAWRRTRAAWKQSQAFAIGPAKTLDTAARIDWTPTKPERIESELAGSAELTADHVEDLGANLKGFLALEYLLFDPEAGDAAVVDALIAGARRRAFVRALAENLRNQTLRLRDAWDPAAGNFAAQLGDAGLGSTTYPTVKSAVDGLVNQMIFLSEDLADTQLLAALGRRTGGAPDPEALPAHRSGNGLADLLDGLAGMQNVYFDAYAGRRGASFDDVVSDLNPSTAAALSLAIQRALETAARIPHPLEQALTTDAALVDRAQVRAKELMRRLEIDLVSILGSTLRFNPSDGD